LRQLLSRVIIVTPNSNEARQLSGKQDLTEAAEALLSFGCRHVLITGTHEQTPAVTNTLYSTTRRLSWTWPRLARNYHGSGCTLASALATLLGTGLAMDSAAGLAQEYTWHALSEGWALGKGQYHPRRLGRMASLF
jgi:hydroxymethylpyrimidine/phosphomethylpyrimidine kinase